MNILVIYISDTRTENEYYQEVAYFTTSLLVSKSNYFIIVPGFFIQVHKNMDKLNFDWVMYLMNSSLTDEYPETKELIKEMKKMKVSVDQIKKNKHKSKADVFLKHKFDSWILATKKLLKSAIVIKLIDNGFSQFIDLIDPENNVTNYSILYPETLIDENRTLLFLFDVLRSKDGLPLLNIIIKKQFKNKDITIIKIEDQVDSDFISFPIFEMQYNYYSSDKKEIIFNLKSQIQAEYLSLFSNIEKFIEDNFNKKYDEELNDAYYKLYEANIDSLNNFQEKINNNIYFHKLMNSDDEYKILRVNIGVTSINTMIDHYEKIEVLQPFLATALKDKLQIITDLSFCKFFYFIEIIETVNK